MELHQIRYFLAACETLNFTRAAEQCGVSVPSLSRAIRSLEEELGGQLFRRERHLTHLTDLGRLMQQHFATVQAATDAARRDAQSYAQLSGGALRLGVFASIGADLLTGYLAELRSAAPEIELQIWEANCEEIESALFGGEIDVALTSAPKLDGRIRALPLFEEAYHVAFAAGHRFEGMNTVPMRELEGENYIKRLHCEFPSNFALLGTDKPYRSLNVRYVGEREDWVQAMVRAGLGCTVMPEFLPLLRGVLTRKLIEPEVSRHISIVSAAGRPHSAPVAAAVRAARSYLWPNTAERRETGFSP
jgi:LysR family transcriptional regulator, hydrogen peroxide-inducible genes activator